MLLTQKRREKLFSKKQPRLDDNENSQFIQTVKDGKIRTIAVTKLGCAWTSLACILEGSNIYSVTKSLFEKIKHMIHGFPQPHQHRNQEWR